MEWSEAGVYAVGRQTVWFIKIKHGVFLSIVLTVSFFTAIYFFDLILLV